MFRNRKFVFTDEAKQAFLDHLEEHGLLAKAARHIGTTSTVVKREIKDDKEFKEAFDHANELYGELLQEEIHRRGVTGIQEPQFYKGELMPDTKTVYSDQLLIAAVKANVEKFKDKSKQDIHITGGVLVAAPIATSPEAWLAAQEEAKRLAALPDKQLPEAEETADERVIDVESTESV